MAITKMIDHRGKSLSGMKACIRYCMREDKVKQGYCTVTGPYAYENVTADNVIKSFIEEKELWNKTTGYRQYVHTTISFHRDDPVTPEMALEFGREICESDAMFCRHQCLICVHEDSKNGNLHLHIITNTVSFLDGKIENHGKPELKALKQHVDELCIKNGLQVTVKGKRYDGTDMRGEIVSDSTMKYRALINNEKESYLADCAVKVLDAIKYSSTKEEFINKMNEINWECIWSDTRKYIVFVNDEGKRVRATNLAKTFHLEELQSKETLEAAIKNEFVREERSESEYEYVEPDDITSGAECSTFAIDADALRETAGIAKAGITAGANITKTVMRQSKNEEKKSKSQRKGKHL